MTIVAVVVVEGAVVDIAAVVEVAVVVAVGSVAANAVAVVAMNEPPTKAGLNPLSSESIAARKS
jgi:hypothetical protein